MCEGSFACWKRVEFPTPRDIFPHDPGGAGHKDQEQERHDEIEDVGWDEETCNTAVCKGVCALVNAYLTRLGVAHTGLEQRQVNCVPCKL